MLLFPSLNCCNFDNLKKEVLTLDSAGADGFHLDVSDGTIFPHWSMGFRDFEAVRRNTKKLVDIHLYVSNPEQLAEEFAQAGADIIYVFPEADKFIVRTLLKIKKLKKHPGLALGWYSNIKNFESLMPLVDYVMVNISNPIEAKSLLLENIDDYLKEIILFKDKYNFKVFVDGAVTYEVIRKMNKIGIDGYAMGTGCLFNNAHTYQESFDIIRNSI